MNFYFFTYFRVRIMLLLAVAGWLSGCASQSQNKAQFPPDSLPHEMVPLNQTDPPLQTQTPANPQLI